ncbi:hypothetical protein EJ08DRAFT_702391 [Tothia fuscella]|uniref:LysM domain-containing protein n=1 Tax=Tothia fuscella TaxID=1048955 RepID=A0A9P4TTU9_9PEZI|nr:hypothetical protein EJ08DRAFT_702391 [Tothia fuscella]
MAVSKTVLSVLALLCANGASSLSLRAQASPTQVGIAKDCTKFHQAVEKDTCSGIVSKYGNFNLQQFSWKWQGGCLDCDGNRANPFVTDCAGLGVGYKYCVAVPETPTSISATTKPQPTNWPKPTPTQPNVTLSCNKWYLVVENDICLKVVNKINISLADFYTWNPDVGSTCAYLLLGYYVCVGVA